MRNNTPPSSPFFEREDMNQDDFLDDDDGEDDELIYVGDADEVLARLEAESDDEDEPEQSENIDEEYVPPRDDALVTFSGHKEPVFCGSFHPTENLAVTGGQDDIAYVWSTETGNVVFAASGHKDTVVATEFSADGNYLATGDMAGYIQVFKPSQDYKQVWEYEIGDMSWMQWHFAANVLFVGTCTGDTYVFRIPSGDCKVLQGNGTKAEVGELTADGKRLIIGYTDGCVKLFDIKTSTVIQSYEPNTPLGHSEAITSIAADPDNGRFLTGSSDGKIMIANNNGPLSNLFPSAGSIEALAFSPDKNDLRLVACGTLEGTISLWDINRQAIRFICRNEDPTGVTKILWGPNHTLLCATLDGSIRLFDGRSGASRDHLLGHAAEVYDIKFKASTNQMLTTSEDKTAKIFKLDYLA